MREGGWGLQEEQRESGERDVVTKEDDRKEMRKMVSLTGTEGDEGETGKC